MTDCSTSAAATTNDDPGQPLAQYVWRESEMVNADQASRHTDAQLSTGVARMVQVFLARKRRNSGQATARL